MNRFKNEKGVYQGCILSPCIFNFYAEHITRNPRLEKSQAGIKIAGSNINNFRYPDNTTLMAESESEVKWKSLSRVRLFATPWTIQPMEFSRPEYWSELPFPSPGIEPRSPVLPADSLPSEPPRKPKVLGRALS